MIDPKQVGGSPRAEVLRIIQRAGSASVKDLEAAMGVTTTAVREQVAHLLHEGFLHATRVRGEIGRPYYVYALTAEAQDLFPKDYATLAILLLEEARAEYGDEGLRALLNGVSKRMAAKFPAAGEDRELSQKLLGLVAALGQAGMEVSMRRVEDGDFILRTHSCPYFDVARDHGEICQMEQEMLADLLGPGVEVKVAGRIVDGLCSCDFHVTQEAVEDADDNGLKERAQEAAVLAE